MLKRARFDNWLSVILALNQVFNLLRLLKLLSHSQLFTVRVAPSFVKIKRLGKAASSINKRA